jgi:cobalt-zinc-cadmium efflux system membrane fusion protein
MNNRIAGALPLRHWVALAICLSFATADAAEPPIRLTIADSQVQALGIQTQPLSPSSGAVTARFAAEVTLPPQAARRISAPLAGMVTELLVQPDQAVRAGDPLLRLAGPQWGALQSALLQADARARLARQSLQREQALFAEGIIPQRRLQEAQTALAESEAVLGQARMALQATGLPMALVEQLLSAAKPQQNLTLTAPTAGRVSQIEVQPGQQVEAADALLQLTQPDPLWLAIRMPVSEGDRWQPGTALTVAGKTVAARLLRAGTILAADSQTFVWHAVVERGGEQLRPGEFVAVELAVAEGEGSWEVPLAAIARDGDQACLFVRTAEGFEARPVRILASGGQQVRVQGLLQSGEQIAVSGVVALKGAWLDARGGE